ncbi:MAG: hypothetical protein IPL92_03985 [Saprospiraceae bacterium]|nr:hypothetical protein [Candidatus Opimibacter iunctus]
MKRYAVDNEALGGNINPVSSPEKKRQILALSISLLSFLLASSIYLFYRETSNILYQVFASTDVSNAIDSLRSITPPLPPWLIYSLPDGLWMLSFCILILTIWGFQRSREAIAWIIITLAIGGFLEFSQALNILPGHFDWSDLAIMLIAVLLPLCFTHKSSYR